MAKRDVWQRLSGQFSIAILDVMMPRMNGLETLRQIRAQSRFADSDVDREGDDTDRIVGLELGADDYVTSPALRANWWHGFAPFCAVVSTEHH